MIRILYIHHGGGIGGAPLSLLYLLRQLDRTKYEPIVLTLKPGPVVDLYRSEGIETHTDTRISDFSHTNLEWYGGRDWWRLPGKLLRFPASVHGVRRWVRELKPDIVHLNSSTLTAGALGASREDVPVVWHVREPLHRGVLGLRRALIRRVLDRTADRVVAISHHDADQLTPSDRIHVIHNFVDFTQFDRSLDGASIRAEFGISPDAPVVLMLGGVAKPKGTLPLIQAIPRIIKALPDARIIAAGPPPGSRDETTLDRLKRAIAGDAAYQQRVIRALEALPDAARDAIIFTGIRRDVPNILAASNVLVFPSVVPHFARPVIEAAAMGVPSVASDLGGPRELIVHGETGLLAVPSDPDALADALIAVLRDPERARQMGEAGYQRARKMFDATRNAAATIALYNDLV